MTNDHRHELEAAVRSIVAERPAHDATQRLELDSQTWKKLDDLGFVCLALPERLGGSGGDLRDAAISTRAAALTAAPLMEAGVLAAPLLHAAQLAWPGGVVTAAAGNEVHAVRDGGRLQLSGHISRVPWLEDADHLVVLVDLADGAAATAVLPRSELATRRGRNLAGEPRDEAALDKVTTAAWAPVNADHVSAFALRGALGRACQIAGAAEHALEWTTRHVREREQFGRPLIAFQAVQHRLAQLAADVTTLRVCTDAAAAALAENRSDAVLLAAAAKVEASALAHSVAATSHQLHGAIGFTREHHLAAASTRLWAWRDENGSEHVWQRYIADLVRDAGSDVWGVVTDGLSHEGTTASP